MGSGKTWDMFQEYPDVFAGLAPHSALFPVHDNPFGRSIGDEGMNMDTMVPVFYSGGEKSFLGELPFQSRDSLDRIKYLSSVNRFKRPVDVDFEDKDNWENPIWGINGDKTVKIRDEERDSILTVNYFESEDGVIRTALASVSNQIHECRHHSCEAAWKFISQFSR